MKKILLALGILVLILGLVACGQSKDEKKYQYAGIEIKKNDYKNIKKYEKQARSLYTSITTFNPAKDGNSAIDDIVSNGNELKMIIYSGITKKPTKDNIQRILLTENVSIVGIPKNAIKYSREITDTEMLLINNNFKALNSIEAKKVTTDKKKIKAIVTELNDNVGIEIN